MKSSVNLGGFEPTTLWLQALHSNHWTTIILNPANIGKYFLNKSMSSGVTFIECQPVPCFEIIPVIYFSQSSFPGPACLHQGTKLYRCCHDSIFPSPLFIWPPKSHQKFIIEVTSSSSLVPLTNRWAELFKGGRSESNLWCLVTQDSNLFGFHF